MRRLESGDLGVVPVKFALLSPNELFASRQHSQRPDVPLLTSVVQYAAANNPDLQY